MRASAARGLWRCRGGGGGFDGDRALDLLHHRARLRRRRGGLGEHSRVDGDARGGAGL